MKTVADLSERHCAACNEETPALNAGQVKEFLPAIPEWKLAADGKRIRREWQVKDFATGLAFFTRVRRNRGHSSCKSTFTSRNRLSSRKLTL